jgi:hypothetical protein
MILSQRRTTSISIVTCMDEMPPSSTEYHRFEKMKAEAWWRFHSQKPE